MVKVRVVNMRATVRSLTPHRGCFYQTKPNSAPLDKPPGGSAESAQLRNEAKSCAADQPARVALIGPNYDTKPNLALLSSQRGALKGPNYETNPTFPPLASHRRGR